MATVYEAAGRIGGLLRLAEAWHARVMADEEVSHAFSHGYRPDHSERLAAYWAEALGGPPMYSQRYGDETSVVRIHSGNGSHEEMDRRAIACFDQAAPAGAARLLRLGHHHRDGPLPPVRRRRAGRPAHPALVLGRASAGSGVTYLTSAAGARVTWITSRPG
jgi:truncated hemoglobin YjbI